MKKKRPPRKRGSRPASPSNPKTAEGRGDERKDHVLQARVPPSLYNDLVAQARRLRVPVSNLIRNILEDSTRMVGNIVEGSIEIAEAIAGGVGEEELSSVLGWQPMIANKRLACSHCGSRIEKGREAFISVGTPGSRTYVICEGCKCGM